MLKSCLGVDNNLPVEVLRLGLGATATQLRLCNTGPAHIHGAWSQISETDGEAISIVRLADVLTARGIAHVDLWKLDVEGYEIPALQGAEDFLIAKQIKALYVELAGDNG